MSLSIDVVDHRNLSDADLAGLQRLFDSEYIHGFGPWDPERPYGYAPHDVHVIARLRGCVVGHAGWARREIAVGSSDVVVAGTGGVLVAAEARGGHAGAQIMSRAVQSMRARGDICFGYLGCREDVVPFYASCGWTRIVAREASIGRDGERVVDEPGPPIMVRPVGVPLNAWPDGDIDLRGRAW